MFLFSRELSIKKEERFEKKFLTRFMSEDIFHVPMHARLIVSITYNIVCLVYNICFLTCFAVSILFLK